MLFDRLEEVGKTWHIYYTDAIWALMLGGLRTPASRSKILKWTDFLSNAKDGKLPNYTWLEPRFAIDPTNKDPAQDQHPDHPVQSGEQVMREVYEALRSSPQWNDTLLLITYDEHGGFYDHFPTPMDGVPNPDGRSPNPPLPSGFNFDRGGIRVPMIAVSPWINKGTVVHEPVGPTATSQYEHSSIAATMKKIFNTKSFLTKRDEWAGTFEGILTQRSTPRTDCPVKLPAAPTIDPEVIEIEANLPLNELQCDFIKAFPGGDAKFCNLNQLEGSKYIRQLVDNYMQTL